MRRLANIFRLGVKELYSLRRDLVLVGLIVWAFTFSIYAAATGMSHDLKNAAVAVVDEDRSPLSIRIREALLPPQFQEPVLIGLAEIDRGLDTRRYSFVLVIPEHFEADLLAGHQPEILVEIDATLTMQAGIGASQIGSILAQEITRFVAEDGGETEIPVSLQTRYAFNPNITTSWFTSIMEIINNVTVLTIVLTGAALIREREHGTIEHLLVMPLTPIEIMLAKVWANGLVIVAAVAVALWVVVERTLAVPIAGSIPLFLAGTALYLFFAAALGIFLGTIARSMPQFGLLFILVALPINMLSGGETPLESQPEILQTIMQAVPSTHYVSLAQAILFRGAGLGIVWPHFVLVAVVGGIILGLAALGFRRSMANARS
jgi:ABC-2 type transport system permease protein